MNGSRGPAEGGDKWYAKGASEKETLSSKSKKEFMCIGRVEERGGIYVTTPEPCQRCRLLGVQCKSYTLEVQVTYGFGHACSRCSSMRHHCSFESDDDGAEEDTTLLTSSLSENNQQTLPKSNDKLSMTTTNNPGLSESTSINSRKRRTTERVGGHAATKRPRLSSSSEDKLNASGSSCLSVKSSGDTTSDTGNQPQNLSIGSMHNLPTTSKWDDGGIAGRVTDAIRLKHYLVARLSDGPKWVVATSVWAEHQLATMEMVEALQSQVNDLKKRLENRNDDIQSRDQNHE